MGENRYEEKNEFIAIKIKVNFKYLETIFISFFTLLTLLSFWRQMENHKLYAHNSTRRHLTYLSF